MEGSRPQEVVCFGPYEIRLRTQELFKHGLRLKLAPQAFQVLRILLDRPGDLVTREDLHQALWSADTFVDFDHGLNNAIKRIRDVLNDSVDAPLYIETLPRLGYRFVGHIPLVIKNTQLPMGPDIRRCTLNGLTKYINGSIVLTRVIESFIHALIEWIHVLG